MRAAPLRESGAPTVTRPAGNGPTPTAGMPERGAAPDADIEAGRAVLEAEGAGLAALAASLGASFAEAVSILAAVKGRVVVTGMGKSGHIARKIAATLASTGTPALFVHPAEASHGDLGMIVEGDCVLALSNSGETAELADLVAHTRRFGLKLLAITARETSALARAADVLLHLPAAKEACPLGLAPTTSTTMQLALGDALAVALLTRRGFSPSDFRVFHPGGKLGARLTRVRDLMHGAGELPLATSATPMQEALIRMTERRFGCLGIVDESGRPRRHRDGRRPPPRHGARSAHPQRRRDHERLAPHHRPGCAGRRGSGPDEPP